MRATASEENDEIARRAHETATHNCSPNAVAEKYLNVYREVIAHE
jgi:glycogen synthase